MRILLSFPVGKDSEIRRGEDYRYENNHGAVLSGFRAVLLRPENYGYHGYHSYHKTTHTKPRDLCLDTYRISYEACKNKEGKQLVVHFNLQSCSDKLQLSLKAMYNTYILLSNFVETR